MTNNESFKIIRKLKKKKKKFFALKNKILLNELLLIIKNYKISSKVSLLPS